MHSAFWTFQSISLSFISLCFVFLRNVDLCRLRTMFKHFRKCFRSVQQINQRRPLKKVNEKFFYGQMGQSESALATEELCSSCERGDLANVQRLVLEGKVGINTSKDDGKWTPLHFACESLRFEVAQFLVQRGADGDEKKKRNVFLCLIFFCSECSNVRVEGNTFTFGSCRQQ